MSAETVAGNTIAASTGRRIAVVVALAAIVFGIAVAYQRRWQCDDAFISYRYARNLVEGRGLVFNEGERVEGYTNFLWTLGCAAALALGIRAEAWTIFWGILSYAACLGLLALLHLRLRRAMGIQGLTVPLAAVLAALHEDWAIYATSGLETSLFTLLLLGAFVVLVRTIEDGRPRPLSVALLLAAAALTRPDALVFVAVAGVAIGWISAAAAAPVLRFAIVWSAMLRWLRRPLLQLAVAAAAVAAIALPPYPMAEDEALHGVANEWMAYGRDLLDESGDQTSATLRRYFDGLPVRVAFIGSGAHLVERARIPVAIEAETGLTDRFIARQKLPGRRRVGHEKHAPPEYLIRERRVHFGVPAGALGILDLERVIPAFEVSLDGVSVVALHWDPVIMAELRRRGAVFGDLPAQLDQLLAGLDRFSDAQVADFYAQLRLSTSTRSTTRNARAPSAVASASPNQQNGRAPPLRRTRSTPITSSQRSV